MRLLDRYCFEFCAVPVVFTLEKLGFFEFLEQQRDCTFTELEKHFFIDKAYLRFSLNLFVKLGWLEVGHEDGYSLTTKAMHRQHLNQSLLDISAQQVLSDAHFPYLQIIVEPRPQLLAGQVPDNLKLLVISTDDFLMHAAANGLFVANNHIEEFLENLPFSQQLDNQYLIPKEYRIRQASFEDIDVLMALEQRCWSEELCASPRMIRHRLQSNPRGQFIVEVNKSIVGVLYTQRVQTPEDVYKRSETTIGLLHDPQGKYLQLLSIFIDPTYQHLAYGSELREFALLMAKVTPGIEEVIAVTRCQHYADHQQHYPQLQDYVYAVNAAHLPLDPTLNFHVSRGARIEGLVEGYRPRDKKNNAMGVFIRYDLNTIFLSPMQTEQKILVNNLAKNDVQFVELIYSLIQQQLPKESSAAFDPQMPFIALGIDSMGLTQLRQLVRHTLAVELDIDVFFKHPTPVDFINFLAQQPLEISPMRKRSLQRKQIVAAQLKRESQLQASQPIAITGMALRFPKANSLQEYWELMQQGKDAITDVPEERWKKADVAAGTVSYAGFVEKIDYFDAEFFSISAAEAKQMDPQQRLLMEVTWHALESAGINPKELKGQRVGIFIGQFSHDYELLQAQATNTSVYYATGNSSSISAGRLSYFLGSQGPTITLDTACSSSLVAVHLAQKSLQHGECDVAIVGGVNAILAPQLQETFTQSGMLAPDGRCKSFDKDANGYVRSEGCGVVVLQRIVDAQAHRHPILAVIKGSAINHDGHSNGLTAPNGQAQEALLKFALEDARLNMDAIDYLEAHGTGTSLGDPIELNAIKNVFTPEAKRQRPLIIGTAKTYIGHLEAAAGIAGLIKTILSLRHQSIPKLLNFNQLNPHIELNEAIQLAVQPQDWKRSENHVRRAGISSFGFSGTNAHVIIEEVGATGRSPSSVETPFPWSPFSLVVISAKTEAALIALKNEYLIYLAITDNSLANIAYTSAIGRSHFHYRMAIIARSKEDLITQLENASTIAEDDNNILTKLATSYLAGEVVDWQHYYADTKESYRRVALPLYAFQREPYWFEESQLLQTQKPLNRTLNFTWSDDFLLSLYAREASQDVLNSLAVGNEYIEQLALTYILDAFHQTGHQAGWSYAIDDRFNTADAQAHFSVKTHHTKLFQQLLQELIEEGVLTQEQEYWRVLTLLPTKEVIASRRQMCLKALESFSVVTIEKHLLMRCGAALWSVLTGHQAPLELLFPQDEWQSKHGSATVWYQDAIGIKIANSVLAQTVRQLIASTVPGMTLRLLEIGAGTGGTTRPILAALQQANIAYEYTYTDISSGFFMTAKEVFGENRMVYRKLNIEQDPSLQGFISYHYDVIIASNVLHATKNLSETLKHTRQLLASQGCLLLLEIGQPSRFLNLTFGLLEGWWRFEDTLRTDHALLTPSQWQVALVAAGFDHMTSCHEPAVIFAQANSLGQEYNAQQNLTTANISSLIYTNVWELEPAAITEESNIKKALFLLNDKAQAETLISISARKNISFSCLLPSGEYYTASGWQSITLEEVLTINWSEIVYAWSLKYMAEHQWNRAEQRGVFEELFSFIHALANTGQHLTFYLLTQGAQSIHPDDKINLCQAPLNGFCKTLLREYTHWSVSHIDFDPAQSVVSQFPLVLSELEIAHADQDLEIVYRQAQRLVSRIARANPQENISLLIPGQGSYLITGGLSGLGLATAKLLIQRGARQLILAARRTFLQLDVSTKEQLNAWQAEGVNIRLEPVDVSDAAQVEALLRKIQTECLPLKGIIHSAGLLMDDPIAKQNWAHMEYVFKPKVYGAWHLHYWTQQLQFELDYFVVYSSTASFLGNAGQVNHASANAFLDAFVYHRQQQGLAAQTIHWGPWAEIGTAAVYKTTFEKMGFTQLTVAEGIAALEHALTHPKLIEIAVVSADWDTLSAASTRIKRWVSPIQQVSTPATLHTGLQTLKDQPAVQQRAILEQKLVEYVATILGTDKNEFRQQYTLDIGFSLLGFDSLMTMEFRNRVQRWLGETVPLTSTVIFDYPSITELTTHLYAQIGQHYPDLINTSASKIKTSHDKIVRAKKHPEATEAIAIIGLGCRFPGSAETVDQYWQLLQSGEDTTTDISHERIDITEDYSVERDVPGKMYTRRAAFIRQNVQSMDAGFFNMSPKEACYLDPQQRLLMEVVWEALENAGIPPHDLKHTDTGIFIGLAGRDYADLIARTNNAEGRSAYTASGTAFSTASGRLSFWLGCQGPAISIDTACSSSLVALHQAIRSIEAGECHLAIVGGASILLSTSHFINLSQAGMLSEDGRCKAFDDSADGFGRGEGCGVVILKHLIEAQANNDNILAVISSSAINQDGPSSGLTAPNGPAQEQLLHMALDKAHLMPNDIDYIEAHGTGTSLGDPIEFNAIKNVFTTAATRQQPLLIGTVKTNIGHLEAAAGMAGLIKTVLSLQHQRIPKLLHFRQVNRHIELNEQLNFPIETRSWPTRAGHVRRAGISSFGFSGTNAHVIVEEAPLDQRVSQLSDPTHPQLFVFSAKSKEALVALKEKYLIYVSETTDRLCDIAYTTAVGRSHFLYRIAIIASTKEEFIGQLKQEENTAEYDVSEVGQLASAYLAGESIDWRDYYSQRDEDYRKVNLPNYAFQRQQHWLKGLNQLSAASIVRKSALTFTWREHLLPATYAQALDNYPLEKMAKGNQYLEQLALTYILDAFHQAGWSYVIGDCFTLIEIQQVLAISNVHTRLCMQLLNELVTEGILQQHALHWQVLQDLPSITKIATQREVILQRLQNYSELRAEHYLLIRCGAALQGVLTNTVAPLGLLFPQDKTEERLGSAAALYRENPGIQLGNRVLAETLRQIVEKSSTEKVLRILEIGAGTGSTTRNVINALNKTKANYEYTYTDISSGFFFAAKEIFGQTKVVYRKLNIELDPQAQGFGAYHYDIIIASNVLHATKNLSETLTHVRNLSAPQGLLLLLETSQSSRFLDLTFGLLEGWWRFDDNLRVDNAFLNANQWKEALITMGFEHVAHCHESSIVLLAQADLQGQEYVYPVTASSETVNPINDLATTARHPLLGYQLPLALPETVYQQTLTTTTRNMLSQHGVLNYPIMPATAYIEILLAVAQENFSYAAVTLSQFEMKEPLLLEKEIITLQTVVQVLDDEHLSIKIYSLVENEKTHAQTKLHAIAQVHLLEEPLPQKIHIETLSQRCPTQIQKTNFYAMTRDLGYAYQGLFQGIESVCSNQNESLIKLTSTDGDTEAYIIHPALLDSALQAKLINLKQGEMLLPGKIEQISVYAVNDRQPVYAYHQSKDIQNTHIALLNKSGEVIVQIHGFKTTAMPRRSLQNFFSQFSENASSTLYYSNVWESQTFAITEINTTHKILFLLSDKEQVHALMTMLPVNITICYLLPTGEYYSAATGWVASELNTVLEESWVGIIYAWTLAISEKDSWEKTQQRTLLEPLLNFVKVLARKEKKIRLCLLTQGAQSVGSSDALNISHAALNGFSKILHKEYSEWSVSHIDLDPALAVLPQLATVLNEIDAEVDLAIAYRQQNRLVSRLSVEDQPSSTLAVSAAEQTLQLKENASYLITGGLSGLGLVTAERLVQRGAKQLILVGRRAVDAATQQQLVGWKALGVDIHVKQVDISEETQVKALLFFIQQHCRPLKGIIHSAGVLMDSPLAKQEWEQMEYVFKPKVYGAWYLHQWTQSLNIELDYFVMYSSAALFLGNVGQASYASANAFLNSLAHLRQSQGLKGQAIHWGTWAETGMAPAYRQLHEKVGFIRFSVSEGLEAMEYVLTNTGLRDVLVLSMDWKKVHELATEGFSRFISHLYHPRQHQAQSILLEVFESKSALQREKLIEEKIIELVANTLGMEKTALQKQNVLDTGFTVLGFDSLMVVELRNRLQRWLGEAVLLANTVIFDYPSILCLREHVYEKLHQAYPQLSNEEKKKKRTKKQFNIIQNNHEHAGEKPTDAIAVVGLSCRFPGAAETAEQYWELLRQGQDATTDIPSNRMAIDAIYSPDRQMIGKTYTYRGAFIQQDVQSMDAAFFNITPKEAKLLDPQQRLLLEVAVEALEHAGIPLNAVRNSDTGVFVGISSSDYSDLLTQVSQEERSSAYLASGTALSIASGRLAFWLGCQGPTMSIDTACSSSLVSLHQAIKSIESGECQMAIVGGVHLMLSENNFINFSQANMLSEDGRCKAFDAAANGFGRGEGCGVVILKKLNQAQADKDHILAVIRGSAVNQDGPSGGLTVPNGPAQEKLIQTALQKAHLIPSDIDYLETHGTGTSLGDPIELNAIRGVFAREERISPLIIGAVKNYIGHLEAAAGMAGLIATILALQHQRVPKLLHFKALNPMIETNGNLKLLTEAQDWKYSETRVRRAGVSSFGFSGTNAHVIVEEAPREPCTAELFETHSPQLLLLSAKTDIALQALKEKYIVYLETTENKLQDIVYTSAVGRQHFSCRIAVIAHTKKGLLHKLVNSINIEKDANTLNQLAQSYLAGDAIDWHAYYAEQQNSYRKVHLPTYAFQRTHYWIEKLDQARILDKVVHPLLGACIRLPAEEMFYQQSLSESSLHYLSDHQVMNIAIMPGAAFLEMVTAAGHHAAFALLSLDDAEVMEVVVHDIQIKAPLLLQGEYWLQTRVTVERETRHMQVRIFSCHKQTAETRLHIEGNVQLVVATPPQSYDDMQLIKQRCHQIMTHEIFYPFAASLGFAYQASFQTIDNIRYNAHEAFVTLKTVEENIAHYYLPPTLFDGIMQTTLMTFFEGNVDEQSMVRLPVGFTELKYFGEMGGLTSASQIHLQWQRDDAGLPTKISITIYDATGELRCHLKELKTQAMPRSQLETFFNRLNSTQKHTLLETYYESAWQTNDAKGAEITFPGQTLWLTNLNQDAPLIVTFHIEQVVVHWQSFVENLVSTDLSPVDACQLLLKHLLNITQTILDADTRVKRFLLWSQGAHESLAQAGLSGFMHSLTLELAARGISCCHIDTDSRISQEQQKECVEKELNTSWLENEIRYRHGKRYVNRLKTVDNQHSLVPKESGPYTLVKSPSGLIDELYLSRNMGAERAIQSHELRIQIKAAGLNFRDVLNAMNLYPGDAGALGGDFAGIISEVGSALTEDYQLGDRVLGMGTQSAAETQYRAGCFSSEIIIDARLALRQPSQLNHTECAGLPAVFLTSYEALIKRAGLKVGEKILIHTATGGVGLSAIQVAQQVGAEIYATAGSERKRDYLRHLGITHVYDSRSLDYGAAILTDTVNKGVDVVLNTLTGKGYIDMSLSVCASNARFIEISKRDIWRNEQIGAQRPDIAYTVLALDEILQENPGYIQQLWAEILPKFEANLYQALPYEHYSLTQAKEAFHAMQRAEHIGKIVLSIVPEYQEKLKKPTGSFLITGGLRGLGFEVAKFLVTQEVKQLILVGRQAPGIEVANCIQQWQTQGIEITVLSCDIGDEAAIASMFDQLRQNSISLQGIIHAAGVIHDNYLEKQTWAQFEAVLRPKLAAWYLHHYSQPYNDALEYFIVFSSAASTLGNVGQINYAAANSFMDELIAYRRRQSLSGQSIHWGPWADVGMAADTRLQALHRSAGFQPFSTERGIALFKTVFFSPSASPVVVDVDWSQFVSVNKESRQFLNSLVSASSGTLSMSAINKHAWINTLVSLSYDECCLTVEEKIKTLITQVSLLKLEVIFSKTGFMEMGLDSLSMIELKNRLQQLIGNKIILSNTLLFDYPNLKKLSQYIVQSCHALKPKEKSAHQEPRRSATTQLEKQLVEVFTQKLGLREFGIFNDTRHLKGVTLFQWLELHRHMQNLANQYKDEMTKRVTQKQPENESVSVEMGILEKSCIVEIALYLSCLIESKVSMGKDALFTSIRKENKKMLASLFENGVEINMPDPNGKTGLHLAVILGNEAMALWLLSQGADINHPTKLGITPFMLMLFHQQFSLAQESLQYSPVIEEAGLSLISNQAFKQSIAAHFFGGNKTPQKSLNIKENYYA